MKVSEKDPNLKVSSDTTFRSVFRRDGKYGRSLSYCHEDSEREGWGGDDLSTRRPESVSVVRGGEIGSSTFELRKGPLGVFDLIGVDVHRVTYQHSPRVQGNVS